MFRKQNSYQILTKLNILFPYDSTIAVLVLYLKRLKTCPYKNLHMKVYSNFIHNCINLEALKISFSK